MKQCNFIKPNKTQCKAKAVQGDEFCFWQSAKMKEKHEQAVLDGGNSPKRSYGRDDDITIANTQDVLKLVEQTINDLRRNKTNGKKDRVSWRRHDRGDENARRNARWSLRCG